MTYSSTAFPPTITVGGYTWTLDPDQPECDTPMEAILDGAGAEDFILFRPLMPELVCTLQQARYRGYGACDAVYRRTVSPGVTVTINAVDKWSLLLDMDAGTASLSSVLAATVDGQEYSVSAMYEAEIDPADLGCPNDWEMTFDDGVTIEPYCVWDGSLSVCIGGDITVHYRLDDGEVQSMLTEAYTGQTEFSDGVVRVFLYCDRWYMETLTGPYALWVVGFGVLDDAEDPLLNGTCSPCPIDFEPGAPQIACAGFSCTLPPPPDDCTFCGFSAGDTIEVSALAQKWTEGFGPGGYQDFHVNLTGTLTYAGPNGSGGCCFTGSLSWEFYDGFPGGEPADTVTCPSVTMCAYDLGGGTISFDFSNGGGCVRESNDASFGAFGNAANIVLDDMSCAGGSFTVGGYTNTPGTFDVV